MGQIIGHGSSIVWGTAGSAVLAHIVSIGHPSREVEKVDFTTCQSPNNHRETQPGLGSAVEVPCVLNFDEAAATQNTLETDYASSTPKLLTIIYGDGTKTLSGNAFISRLGVGFSDPGGVVTREVSFCFTGKPSWT
jgi:hypothetical protein